MARFYLYEMSRYCDFPLHDYMWPEQKLLDKHYFKTYIDDKTRKAFLIKVAGECAGFALINKTGIKPDIDWKMGEYFILPKFQRRGIGKQVAFSLFNKFKGGWEVSVLEKNLPALEFWKGAIVEYTTNTFSEEIVTLDLKIDTLPRILFLFSSLR